MIEERLFGCGAGWSGLLRASGAVALMAIHIALGWWLLLARGGLGMTHGEMTVKPQFDNESATRLGRRVRLGEGRLRLRIHRFLRIAGVVVAGSVVSFVVVPGTSWTGGAPDLVERLYRVMSDSLLRVSASLGLRTHCRICSLPERQAPNTNAVSIRRNGSAFRERRSAMGKDGANQICLSLGIDVLNAQ